MAVLGGFSLRGACLADVELDVDTCTRLDMLAGAMYLGEEEEAAFEALDEDDLEADDPADVGFFHGMLAANCRRWREDR